MEMKPRQSEAPFVTYLHNLAISFSFNPDRRGQKRFPFSVARSHLSAYILSNALPLTNTSPIARTEPS